MDGRRSAPPAALLLRSGAHSQEAAPLRCSSRLAGRAACRPPLRRHPEEGPSWWPWWSWSWSWSWLALDRRRQQAPADAAVADEERRRVQAGQGAGEDRGAGGDHVGALGVEAR